MNKKPNIIAMIPVRRGSERLKRKNLALIGGKPLVGYAIETALQVPLFNKVVVSTNDEWVSVYAQQAGVEVFKRSEEFASSEGRTDDFVAEFLGAYPCDVVVIVNPPSPLQTSQEVTASIEYFLKHQLDSLITVVEEQVHCVYAGKPVNFFAEGKLEKTQDLTPVMRLVYSVMIWDSKKFIESYQKNGHAFFLGKVGYFPVSKLAGLLVKTEKDLHLINSLVKAKDTASEDLKYWEPVSGIKGGLK